MASAAASDTDIRSLQARIRELEETNARLRVEAPAAGAQLAPRRHDGVWRAITSALCLVLASVLVPASIAGTWVRAALVDEDRFVATMAPLIEDPAVQAMVVEQVSAAVDERVDVAALTGAVFDGLGDLGLPPRAADALDLLRGPASEGLQNLLDETITSVVVSDAFADIWIGALRAAHRAVVAAGSGGGPGGAVTIDDAGVIGLELGPIVTAVKERLLDRGIDIAAVIPDVDRTIVVAQSDALASVRVVYGIATLMGWLLPVVTLALFTAGVLVARRRTTALLGAGAGLAAGSALLFLGLGVGRTVVGIQGVGDVPPNAVVAIFDQLTGEPRQAAVVGMVVGLVVAILAWSQGRWRGAVAGRRLVSGINASIRGGALAHGMPVGGFAEWMDRQRVLVRALISILAVLWLWLLRPLSVGDVMLVAVAALLAWWLAELLRAPRRAPAVPSSDIEPENASQEERT